MMLSPSILSACLLSALVAPAVAQTFTACDPTKTTCPPNPALGMAQTWNLTNSTLDSDSWGMTAGTVDYDNSTAGMFVIDAKGTSTTARSNFYIFFGSVSIVMKASKGQGIVSSVTLLSDDLDEIDVSTIVTKRHQTEQWLIKLYSGKKIKPSGRQRGAYLPLSREFIGGNNTHVQTNYFGKGNNETYDRSLWVPVNNPQNEWHNYTTVWTQDQLEWWIDGQVVRTLPQAKADGGGAQYPQSPTNLSIGIVCTLFPSSALYIEAAFLTRTVSLKSAPKSLLQLSFFSFFTITLGLIDIHLVACRRLIFTRNGRMGWRKGQLRRSAFCHVGC